MNPLILLIDALTIVVCAIAVSGCGREDLVITLPTPAPTAQATAAATVVLTPTVTPTQTPTATPTPNPTLATYIFQDITICAAMRSWNPNTTTIKTYGNSGNGPAYYLFRYDGVWTVPGTGGCNVPGDCLAGSGSTMTFTRSDIHGVVCQFTVLNGQLTGVTL